MDSGRRAYAGRVSEPAHPPPAEPCTAPPGDGADPGAEVVPLEETPGHECGVFAVYAPGQPVAHLSYLGLYALQHRGQESAGMAVSDGDTITVVKDMGLVSNAFDDRTLAALDGHLAIGHTRYSTTGSSTWRNAQPFYRNVGDHSFALAHNGNLTNTVALAAEVGMLPGAACSDSDLVAELVERELAAEPEASNDGRALERALLEVLPRLEGAFSFVVMDEGHAVGVRDPHGFWPLCLGKLDNGWVLASETPALDVVGAAFIREVEPGEMIVIDATGYRSVRPFEDAEVDPKLCLFEFVYFSRPDSQLYGQQRAPGACAHGRAPRRAGARRGRHGHGRARVRAARSRGIRPPFPASRSVTAWSRTATSGARSSPPARSCVRSACA